MSLIQEYRRINKKHKKTVQKRASRIVIGPSVGRVFAKGTVNQIWPVLADMDLRPLNHIKSQAQFQEYFEQALNKLARRIKRTNPENLNPKIYPGYKWGHATKILCLFLHDLVMHRDYFNDVTASRLVGFLYVPIDGIVMKRLKKLGIRLGFSQIKQIDNYKTFYDVQKMLGQAAQKVGVPRIWFDDNWGDRQ